MATQISQQIRQDYDTLLEALMPFAEQMLQKYGEFYPFAAVITIDGELVAHGASEDRGRSVEEVMASLVQAFQVDARDGRIRSTGICYNGSIIQKGNKADAIIVNLEHVSGDASKTHVPYKKGLFGNYKLGDISASQAEPQIFTKV